MCVAGPHVMHMQSELIWLQNTANRPGDKWMFGLPFTTVNTPPCWSRICFTFCLRSTPISNNLTIICTFSQFKVPWGGTKIPKCAVKASPPAGVAVFAGPSWVLQGATSHFPQCKHHLRSPVALYGWCHQTGMVVAPTETHGLLIKQPHHLLFVFLPLCTQCSKLALLWSSKRKDIKTIGFGLWPSRNLSCTRELYFEAADELWEQSKPVDCWECCLAPAWHGWSECGSSSQSLLSMALRRPPPHGDTKGRPWL